MSTTVVVFIVMAIANVGTALAGYCKGRADQAEKDVEILRAISEKASRKGML